MDINSNRVIEQISCLLVLQKNKLPSWYFKSIEYNFLYLNNG